jgi:hypothetical protein
MTDSPLSYTFYCYGHANIRAKHPKTIEFTKDTDLTPNGTCILGIRAEFEMSELKKLRGKVRVRLRCGEIEDMVQAVINADFDDAHEVVFRKSRFNSPRTYGFWLNRGSSAINRDLIALLKNPETRLEVTITEVGKRRPLPSKPEE